MKILHVCNRLTTRVWKQAFTLQQQGHHVVVLYSQMAIRGIDDTLLFLSRWTDWQCLASKLAALGATANVVHVHTSLTALGMVDAALAAHGNVVWDIHDWSEEISGRLKTLRARVPQHTRMNIVTPSVTMASTVTRLLADPHIGVTTIYSKVPAMFCRPPSPEPLPTTIALNSHIDVTTTWRDYRQVQQMFTAAGFTFDIFPCDNCPPTGDYSRLRQTLPYLDLLDELAAYGWGYAGAANQCHRIDDCVTNKFWEYLAAGIPVITWRSDEMTQISRRLGVGNDLDSYVLLVDLAAARIRRLAVELLAAASPEQIAMEAEIPQLLAAYGNR